MTHVEFPWRPLGGLLVEQGLIERDELERALEQQRLTGRRLGEILVSRGSVSPAQLATVLAAQHGVELRAERAPGPPPPASTPPSAERAQGWMPLGRLLVGKGLLSQIQLEQSLAEQRRSSRLLGEILVSRGLVSATALAGALAEQHGVALDEEQRLRAVVSAASHLPGEARFEVREARSGEWEPLHASATFLDATDFAFDVLYDREPEALEIVRLEGDEREVVWTYDAETAAAAPGSARGDFLDLYGYPVTRWDAAPWTHRGQSDRDSTDSDGAA